MVQSDEKSSISSEKVRINNSIPDICEFKAKILASNCQNFLTLSATLRVAPSEIRLGNYDCTIELNEIQLAINCEGLEISDTDRYGEPSDANEIPAEFQETQDSALGGDFSVGVEAESGKKLPAFFANGKLTGNKSKKNQVSKKQQFDLRKITALPNNKWSIKDPIKGALNATYLHKANLCIFEKASKANRMVFSISGIVRQRDLVIDGAKMDSRNSVLSKMNQQLLDIFIAKSIQEDSFRHKYRGLITLFEGDFEHA